MANVENRSKATNIKFWVNIKKIITKILIQLKHTYGKDWLLFTQIYNWLNQIQDSCESIENDHKSDHPKSTNIDNNIFQNCVKYWELQKKLQLEVVKNAFKYLVLEIQTLKCLFFVVFNHKVLLNFNWSSNCKTNFNLKLSKMHKVFITLTLNCPWICLFLVVFKS